MLLGDAFEHRNEDNFGIFSGREMGALVGFVAGFYVGYGICLFFDFRDGEESIETSRKSIIICFLIAYASCEIGKFLGEFFPFT
jgi:hypothetical protein